MNFNFYALKKLLQDYSDFHPLLQGSGVGPSDYRSFYNEKESYFPHIYATPLSVSRTRQTTNWNIRVWVLDIMKSDRSNYDDITNTTWEILNDFYNYLEFNKLPHRSIGFSSVPVHNWDRESLTGWYSDITLEAKTLQCLDSGDFNFSASFVKWTIFDNSGNIIEQGEQPCGIDLDITLSDIECSDAEYIIENVGGDLITSGSIPSGGSDTITIQNSELELYDSDNTLIDIYSISPEATKMVQLDFNKPEGITFQIPQPDVEISNRLRDVGWRQQNSWFDYNNLSSTAKQPILDYSHPNPQFNLRDELSFRGVSSKKRFVDILGLQVWVPVNNAELVFIDKLTGLAYTRGPQNGNEDTAFDTAENYSITVDGILIDDWYMVSVSEIYSLYSFDKSNNLEIVEPGTTNFANFGNISTAIRTGSRTVSNFKQVIASSLAVAGVGASSNRTYMLVTKQLLPLFDDYI